MVVEDSRVKVLNWPLGEQSDISQVWMTGTRKHVEGTGEYGSK